MQIMTPFAETERGEIWTGRKGMVVAYVLKPKRGLVDWREESIFVPSFFFDTLATNDTNPRKKTPPFLTPIRDVCR